METIKDYTIAITFILVCSVCILFFVLEYPQINNQDSILLTDSKFNQTANNLSILLGDYQSQVNADINISTADSPQIAGESLQLVSTVSTSRNLISRLSGSFQLITNLLSNSLGVSGGTLFLIVGSIIALFGIVILYLIVKYIRTGY